MRIHLPRALIMAASLVLASAIAAPQVSGQAPKEPGVVILKGAPIGAVKMDHKAHAQDQKVKCDSCHHPSRPERPLKTEHQKCSDCHTSKVAPPMKTNARAAFHDAVGKKGVCIDCHVAENAKGKKAPIKCQDCHKKELA